MFGPPARRRARFDTAAGPIAFGVACLSLSLTVAGCSETAPASPGAVPGAPALTCPADITVPSVQSGSESVIYPKPTLTGGQAPITSSCSPAQGTTFPLGETVVTCTTSDAMNRQASCAFAVRITRSVLGAKTFLAFGDSITAGENGINATISIQAVEAATSYPSVLKTLIEHDYPNQNVTVLNRGIGGEPIACVGSLDCGLERLPGAIAMTAPDALLLLDGYNDLNNAGDVVSRVVDGLRAAIKIAKAAGVKYVFVSTLTPGRTPTGPRDRQLDADDITATNERLRTLVPAEGAYLVDAYAAFLGREQELVNSDGLHLTVEGYRVLAQTFYARIQQVIPNSQQLQGGVK